MALHGGGGLGLGHVVDEPGEVRGDMAVRVQTLHPHEVADVADGDGALQHRAETLDDLRGQLREVGEGLLADPLALPPCLAQEDGGLSGTGRVFRNAFIR